MLLRREVALREAGATVEREAVERLGHAHEGEYPQGGRERHRGYPFPRLLHTYEQYYHHGYAREKQHERGNYHHLADREREQSAEKYVGSGYVREDVGGVEVGEGLREPARGCQHRRRSDEYEWYKVALFHFFTFFVQIKIYQVLHLE